MGKKGHDQIKKNNNNNKTTVYAIYQCGKVDNFIRIMNMRSREFGNVSFYEQQHWNFYTNEWALCHKM